MNAPVKHDGLISEKPTLESLSYALRHQEMWPPGFVWNYRHCRTCALGLAAALWSLPMPPSRYLWCDIMEDLVSMPSAKTAAIFLAHGMNESTVITRLPTDVADDIDRYLGRLA